MKKIKISRTQYRVKAFFLVCAVIILTSTVYAQNHIIIDPLVYIKLNQSSMVPVIVRLQEPEINYQIEGGNFELLKKNAALRSEFQEKVIKTLSATDFKLQWKYYTINAFFGFITASGLKQLKQNPAVLTIEASRDLKPALDISRVRVGADKANAISANGKFLTGEGQIVCVVDTGIDYTHPNLGGCTQAQFLNGNCAKVPGGYDFCGSEDCNSTDTDPIDKFGHGTHVAGIIASNHTTYKGIAPDAKLLAVKVCEDNRKKCTTPAISKAIEWCRLNATAQGIRPSVISISIVGDTEYPAPNCRPFGQEVATDVINSARDAGFFIDGSSGNLGGNGITWPGCVRGVVSVGATYKQDSDSIWSGTSRNENLDLLSPGVDIRSTAFATATECRGAGFGMCTGTSMAAPHVAGAAALIYQLHSLKGTKTNPNEVEGILKQTGKWVYDSRTKREYPRIDVYRAVLSLLLQNQSVNISNTGSADLEVSSVKGNESWLKVNPTQFTKTNNIKAGQSRIVNVSVDNQDLIPGYYTAFIAINSNDPDEGLVQVNISLNYTCAVNLNDNTRGRISKSKPSKCNTRVKQGSISETDKLDFALDWSEQDELNITLTSPNGTNYTINTLAEGVNFTDGHPKILSLTPPALQNGTWTITINAKELNSNREVPIKLQTKPFPSNNPPSNINFSEVKLGFIDTCAFNDNPGFRILMKGVENSSLPTINTSNATDTASKAFLTGLVIPNDKLWLNLPRGQVLINDNFAQTLTAHILLSSDVELKKSGKPEWLQVINNSYNYWDSIIQNTSYYGKVRNKTDWYYPDFTGQRFIIPKNFTLNGSGCDALVEKLELSTISNITTAWVDYSDYGLNQSELDDVNNNKIPQFLTYINNQSNQLLVPALNTQVNNNATFNDMRRVIVSLGIAQWYKTLPRENMQEFKYNPSLKDSILDKKEGVEEL